MSDSSATLWTVACQAPLSMGILQARILEWVAVPSSRGSSRPRFQTRVSHIAGGFFIAELLGKPELTLPCIKYVVVFPCGETLCTIRRNAYISFNMDKSHKHDVKNKRNLQKKRIHRAWPLYINLKTRQKYLETCMIAITLESM